jgi:predicted RNase H-like HicB family nuclease
MQNGKIFYVNITVTADEDGYLARCPDIQGAFAEGDTVEEAVFNCVDVIKMIADYRKERTETLAGQRADVLPDTEISVQMPLSVSL